MNRAPATEGFAIASAFIMLFLFSAVGIALTFYIRQGLLIEKQHLSDVSSEEELTALTENIIKTILENETTEADSMHDSFFTAAGTYSSTDTEIMLEDVSSFINPNWIRKEILDGTSMSEFLAEGKTSDKLQQYRYDEGFSVNLSKFYIDFFTAEASEKFLSPYSFANINTADEFALEKLYEIRTGKNGHGGTFRGDIQQLRIEGKVILPAELNDFLFPETDKLFPFISAFPQMNVNFVPAEILKAVLKYDYGEAPLPYPEAAAAEILNRRVSEEITPDMLKSIVSVGDIRHPVFQYLGTKTWSWRITVRKNGEKLATVCMAFPEPVPPAAAGESMEEVYSGVENSSLRIVESVFTEGEQL